MSKPQRTASGSYIHNGEYILREGNQRKFTVQAHRSASGHTHWRTFSTLAQACAFIDNQTTSKETNQ